MKRITLKQGLLAFLVALLTLSWVGSVNSMPPGGFGFEAFTKGFPGWSEGGRHDKPSDDTEVLRVTSDSPVQKGGYAPHQYPGFNGAVQGNYEENRPRGN